MNEYAGFFNRFVAWLVDGLAMSVLAVIVGVVGGGCLALMLGTEGEVLGVIASIMGCLLFVILSVFQFLYYGYFWSKDGQTLGMKLMNIKVVRRNETEPLSFVRAGLRGSAGYYISSFLFGLGYIWAAFDENKEAWHDKLFDTWVLQA